MPCQGQHSATDLHVGFLLCFRRHSHVGISSESLRPLIKLVSKKLGFGGPLPRFANPPYLSLSLTHEGQKQEM